MAIVDAALMIESGGWKRFDLIVVVDCDEDQQVERLQLRNGLDAQAALERVRAQMPLSEKVKFADRVVDNRGDLDELEGQVAELALWLRKKSEQKVSIGLFPKCPETLGSPDLDKAQIDAIDRADQFFIDPRDKGNGTTRYAGYHIGCAHGHAF